MKVLSTHEKFDGGHCYIRVHLRKNIFSSALLVEIERWPLSPGLQEIIDLGAWAVEQRNKFEAERCEHSLPGARCRFMKRADGGEVHCEGFDTSCAGYLEREP